MTDWLMETLLWTAALIAFVLLVRRPVSRAFGPQIAYALWALPALRLVLPPIELPSWMRITDLQETPGPVALPQAQLQELPGQFTPTALDGSPTRLDDASVAHPDPSSMAATDTTYQLTQMTSFDISSIVPLVVAMWLIGAAIFMVLRFSAYFRLRDELLADAREVGRSGSIRLVETPGTTAPLAFGVIDKVVALPDGFLAHPDRQSRDLALAHELAHHKGGDLLANVLVQPLFAIHWWNPLGRYGWLALRRDQEAACDARVMACAPSEEREIYANLIVSFAAGPNVALAAPMACPVLGEKSIIHRLRSLKMDNTTTKRRLTGKALLGAAVVALPMTASISYAASELPQAPEQPALSAFPVAPVAPDAPSAPEAPEAPLVDDQIIVIDPDGEVSGGDTSSESVFVWKSDESDNERRFIIRRSEGTVRFSEDSDFLSGKRMSQEELERLLERSKDAQIRLRSRSGTTRFFDRSELGGEGQLSEEQIEDILEEVREGLEEANEALENLPEIIEEAQEAAASASLEAGRTMIRVERGCKSGSTEVATESEGADGVKIITICKKGVMAQALSGLREARDAMKQSEDLNARQRQRAVREIERAISRMQREAR